MINKILNTKNSKNFFNLISNKRVALIGPAKYLDLLNLGNLIDSYDIVVRVNRGMEIIEGNEEKIGSKTDILYNCLIEHPDNGGAINIKKLKKLKCMATIPYSDEFGKVKKLKLHPQVNKVKALLLKIHLKLHITDVNLVKKINKKIESRANTGYVAIFDILENKPKELFIAGFSFYLDSFYNGYKKGCERKEDEFAKQCFMSKRHNQLNQWKYFKTIVDDNKNLKLDPILIQIVNMKNLHRKTFKEIIKNYA